MRILHHGNDHVRVGAAAKKSKAERLRDNSGDEWEHLPLRDLPANCGRDQARCQSHGRGGRRSAEISAWLHIGEDGTVTVFTGKVEVGQNSRTSLTQAVAEELRAPVSSIRVVMADTELTPYDAGTFGSRTTPDMFAQL